MKLKILLLVFIVIWFAACSKDSLAGGVSEETNTLAGVLLNNEVPVVGEKVSAHSISRGVSVFSVTDSLGNFSFDLADGLYAVSSSNKEKAFYQLVRMQGSANKITANMQKTFSNKILVSLPDSSAIENLGFSLPGFEFVESSFEHDTLHLKNLPYGSYVIQLESPNKAIYENVAYLVEDSNFTGPYPTAISYDSLMTIGQNQESVNQFVFPYSSEYRLKGFWNFNVVDSVSKNIFVKNLRDENLPFYLYGNVKAISGVEGKALSLKDSTAFAVLESDSSMFDSVNEFSVELWIRVNEIPSETSFVKNILGKVGFGGLTDSSVFSLALVKGTCEQENATLGFFVSSGNGQELSCEGGIFDSKSILSGEWQHIIVSFNQGILQIFKNGALTAKGKVDFKEIGKSPESIYIGKETLSFDIDALRISQVAIDEPSAFFRYYLHGGVNGVR